MNLKEWIPFRKAIFIVTLFFSASAGDLFADKLCATDEICESGVKIVLPSSAGRQAAELWLEGPEGIRAYNYPVSKLASLDPKAPEIELLARNILVATTEDRPSTGKDSMQHADLCKATFPFDRNRVGRNIEGLFLNASEAHVPSGENFILAACPIDIQHISDYFDVLLGANVRTIISLHQVREVSPESAFWRKEVLDQLKLRDGWTIECLDEKVLAVGTEPSFPTDMPNMKCAPGQESKWYPRLVERTLRAKKGEETRIMTHFHYENWHDFTPAPPDLSLIEVLLARKNEIARPEEGCAMNCKSGIGRTGYVAAVIVGTDSLREQVKQGKKSDELTCNIARILYDLRCERAVSASAKRIVCLANFMSRYTDPQRSLQTWEGKK